VLLTVLVAGGAWLWLALASQRLGQETEAQRWLERASRWLDGHTGGLRPESEKKLGLNRHN